MHAEAREGNVYKTRMQDPRARLKDVYKVPNPQAPMPLTNLRRARIESPYSSQSDDMNAIMIERRERGQCR